MLCGYCPKLDRRTMPPGWQPHRYCCGSEEGRRESERLEAAERERAQIARQQRRDSLYPFSGNREQRRRQRAIARTRKA